MKIGIIVYSQTGTTKSVMEQLKERLAAAGHQVALESVETAGDVAPGPGAVELSSAPDATLYDAVVFASPVQAFSLAPAMKAYMDQMGSLEGKRAACLVTKRLPGKWTGGYAAVRRIRKRCQERGATIGPSEIIVWSHKDRDRLVAEAVDALAVFFGSS